MVISRENLRILPSEPESMRDKALEVAIVFAQIFQREAQRAMDGSQHEVPRTIAQLRACLDKLGEVLEGGHAD